MQRVTMTDHTFAAWLRQKDPKWEARHKYDWIEYYSPVSNTIVALAHFKNNPPVNRTIYI